MVAVVSWMAPACWVVERSLWVAAASTCSELEASRSAASRISVTNRFSVCTIWPMPETSGASEASPTDRRRSPERSPWTTSLTSASIASLTPSRTTSA